MLIGEVKAGEQYRMAWGGRVLALEIVKAPSKNYGWKPAESRLVRQVKIQYVNPDGSLQARTEIVKASRIDQLWSSWLAAQEQKDAQRAERDSAYSALSAAREPYGLPSVGLLPPGALEWRLSPAQAHLLANILTDPDTLANYSRKENDR